MANVKGLIPQSLKGIEAILITVLVGGGGYLLYRDWKRNKELADANKAADLATAELAQLQQQGVQPTYTAAQFETWCTSLTTAMNGCGTDEDSIYRVMEYMKSRADVLFLIKQFGVRFYEPCGFTQSIQYTYWLINDQAYGGNLLTWFAYDLSDSNIEEINSILSKKGIDYTF
jgi:hypothetical protein